MESSMQDHFRILGSFIKELSDKFARRGAIESPSPDTRRQSANFPVYIVREADLPPEGEPVKVRYAEDSELSIVLDKGLHHHRLAGLGLQNTYYDRNTRRGNVYACHILNGDQIRVHRVLAQFEITEEYVGINRAKDWISAVDNFYVPIGVAPGHPTISEQRAAEGYEAMLEKCDFFEGLRDL